MFNLENTDPVLGSIGIIFTLLIIATIIVGIMRFKDNSDSFKELSDRVKSWWFMIVIFSVAIMTSPIISVVFFSILSFLAFKEYVSIIPLRQADRPVLFWAYLTIPIQFVFVGTGAYGLFIVFIPVWVFFLLPFRTLIAGNTDGFLKSVATISWGLMITVFAISHTAMLMHFPTTETHLAGGVGLIMFLAILNQGNDVAQYVWGKLFGKNPILPKVSPKKTWEGLIGGLVTTVFGAVLLAPILTPFDLSFSLLAGILIGAAGFIGDVTFSALKRDLKIKDAGSFIPGHGGILDRIDSLALTAPLFFHMTRYFYY